METTYGTVTRGRRWARYREVAKILYEERVYSALRASDLARHAPADLTDEQIEKEDPKKLPEVVRVRLALERLGPAFIKMGQLLSTRRDLISPALADELAKLQDDVPTLPFDQMRPRIEEELGAKIEDVYDSFQETPIASASIAQAYRAKLKDGTDVVVKAQRPGVSETMEVDLDIILTQAHAMAKHTRFGRDFNIVEVSEQIVDALGSDLDYMNEASSLEFFRTSFGDSPDVYFPKVYWDHTTSRVLTMELMTGIPGTHLDELDEKGIDRETVARHGVACYFTQIFEMGRYHADPHLGNLFVMPDGRVGFVDFGRVGFISQRNRDLVFQFLVSLMEGDEVGVTEAVISVTGAQTMPDVSALQNDMGRVCSAYSEAQAGNGSMDKAVRGLFEAVRKYRLALPGEVVMLLTVVAVLEGVAEELSKGEVKLANVLQPFARKLLPEEFGPSALKQRLSRWALRYGRFLADLPVSLTRVLRRAGEGELRMSVRPEKYDRLVGRIEAIANRLCVALLLAALIVGMSFLSGVDVHPAIQISSRIVLWVSIAFGVWWLSTPLRQSWRRRKER